MLKDLVLREASPGSERPSLEIVVYLLGGILDDFKCNGSEEFTEVE